MTEVLSGRYFRPVELESPPLEGTIGHQCLTFTEEDNFPDLTEARVVLLSVPEDRGTWTNQGCAGGAAAVRRELYALFPSFPPPLFADIGILSPGSTTVDTYAALGEAVAGLIAAGKIPLVLGGSQDLTMGNYLGYERLQQTANLVVIDSRLDLGEGEEGPVESDSFLSQLLLRQPNFLFNLTLLGYQSYYVNPLHLQLLEKLYFDTHRLGYFKGRMQESEPLIRNADFVSVDMGAVRFADAPGNMGAGPNGFTGEEICQLMRYAGLSDKLTSMGIYEYNPAADINGVTASLIGQMIWYFMEGVFNRKHDFPSADKTEYLRYRVVLKDHAGEIIFYKSGRSERWWMDVPYPAGNRLRFQRHHLVPCSYEDYLTACRDEMPDRWWKTWQKLS